jgi:fibronectin-binding autotransporter adhesin
MSGTIGTDGAFEWAGGTGSYYDPKQWIDLSDPKNTGTAYPAASGATVTFTSGEVTDGGAGVAVLTVSGNMTFDSGMGGVTTTNNGNVFLSHTTSVLSGDSLDNTGQISGPGGLIFSNTEVIGSITNGGSIDVASLRGDTIDNMSQIAVGFLNVVATLTNSGSVTLSGTNGQIGTLINKGHIDLGSAGVDIGNLINTGTFTAGNAASIIATSADLGGSVFVGGGTTLAVFFATTATVESGTSVQALGAAFNSDTLVVKSGGVVDATGLHIGGTVESGGIVIGGNGSTVLETLTAAGKITATGYLSVDGSVSVTGSIAVTSGGYVLIGPAATLDIAGGTMSTGKSVLDVAHLVNVHGAGSLLTNDQQMAIGLDAPGSAPGTVEVTNQGSISGNDVSMGDDTLATGLGIVNAATWTNSGLVSIGIVDSGTLEVENAGTFTAGSGIVLGGSTATATGTLTIDGAGSLVHAGGGLVVLAGSTAIVTNSASLSTGSTGESDVIGTFPSGTVEADVELTSNATWTSATAIDIGLGTITIGGGTLASATVNIGTDSTLGASALVSASGTDSQWTNSGSIVVGGDAAGTLELATGAVLNASGDVIAGGATDGDGTITVDGTLSVGGNLIVGQDGTGTITVDGAATTLSVGGNLIVGQDGTGSLDLSHSVAISVDGTLQVGGTIGTGTVTDTGADPPRHFGALAINNGVANVAPGADNPWLVDRGTAQNIDIGGVAGGTPRSLCRRPEPSWPARAQLRSGGRATAISRSCRMRCLTLP